MAFKSSSIYCRSFLFWFLLFPQQLNFFLSSVSNYSSGNLHAFLLYLSSSALTCLFSLLTDLTFCLLCHYQCTYYPSAPWNSCNDIYSCLLKYCVCIKTIILQVPPLLHHSGSCMCDLYASFLCCFTWRSIYDKYDWTSTVCKAKKQNKCAMFLLLVEPEGVLISKKSCNWASNRWWRREYRCLALGHMFMIFNPL